MDRNYPNNLITQKFEKAMAIDRADLLRPRTYPHGASPTQPPTSRKLVTPFIFTYSFVRPPVEKWMEEEFHLLQISDKNRKVFPRKPSVVFRQPPNLRLLLVKSRFKELPFQGQNQPSPEKGCHKCDRNRCVTCSVIKITASFTSRNSGRTYSIRYNLDCRSSWIIYLIQCKVPNCGKQYVGRSWRQMRQRHYGHPSQFRNGISEVGKHFSEGQHGYSNVELVIIDQVKDGDYAGLKQKEAFWQHQMMSFIHQGGLNCADDLDEGDYRDL